MEQERCLREKDGLTHVQEGRRGRQGLIRMVDGCRGLRQRKRKYEQKLKEARIIRESDARKCDSSIFIKINTL